MESTLRRTWAEIDLDALAYNYRALRQRVGADVKFLGVVKADAYGHGAVQVSRTLQELGADYLAVSSIDEAAELRSGGITMPILILGHTPGEQVGRLIDLHITQAVTCQAKALEYSREAVRHGGELTVHIKVDTGMHRLGFNVSAQSADTVAAICDLPNVCVEGLFTHFATSAMREKEYVHYQYRGFAAFKEMLAARGVDIPVKHLSNCGIILDSPEYHQDMIRFGSMVFGSYSSNEVCKARVQLKDAFALRAEVACVKELAPGEGVGYDLAFIAQRPTRIAVLPLGYADMICLRRLKNKGYVLLHGKRAPMVGCVCMDQLMIDVTEIENVAMGDVATLIGRDGDEVLTLQEVADRVGTDGYEVLLSNTQRLPIRYWKGGEMIGALDIHQTLLSYYERIYNL